MDSLTLAVLPADIVRMIILMELESIDEMPMISHHWSTIVTSFLSDRKRLPSIKQFIWGLRIWDFFQPCVCIRRSQRIFFGLTKWNELRNYDSDNMNGAFFMYFDDNYQHLKNSISKRFNRCSLVEEFLIYPDGLNQFHVIKDMLREVIVNKLIMRNLDMTVTMTTLRPILCNFISTNSVRNLQMYFTGEISEHWSVLKPDLIEILKISATSECSVEFQLPLNYEEMHTSAAEVRNRWQAKMDDSTTDGNFSLDLEINPHRIAIRTAPKVHEHKKIIHIE